jgi:hypothetical protein
LVLRNPSDKAQAVKLRLQDVFELPDGAAQKYSVKPPWAASMVVTVEMEATEPQEFKLGPFQVITLEMTPE